MNTYTTLKTVKVCRPAALGGNKIKLHFQIFMKRYWIIRFWKGGWFVE